MERELAEELINCLFEEAVNAGSIDLIDELYSSAFVDHSPGPDQAPGPAGIKAAVRRYRNAIPDLNITVEDMIVEGDKIVTRETWRGTHQGELMGRSPTNKSFCATRIHIFRVTNGQIVEEWTEGNVVDQLG